MIALSKRGRVFVVLVAGIALVATAAAAQFQRRGGRFGGTRIRPNPPYDGAFTFCRIMFRNASNGDGGGWAVDYPKADQNLSFRLSELTRLLVSRDETGDYNHTALQLTDQQALSRCPFIMMSEPGGAYLDEQEAKA